MASSDYRAAIDATESAIQRRAILYRNQIAVFGLGTCAIFAGAVLYSWRVLAGLAFLMPISGAFLALDARLVGEWRLSLLPPWTRKEIDFTAFRQAITTHPKLPSGTLGGMLALLPTAETLTKEQAIRPDTRRAVAVVVTAAARVQLGNVISRVTASAIAAVGFVVAIAMRRWEPILALLLIALIPLLRRWRRARIFREADHAVDAARRTVGFDEQAFVMLKETIVSTHAQ